MFNPLVSDWRRLVYSCVTISSEKSVVHLFTGGLGGGGRGLYRAPLEQSQFSHVNFSRSQRTSAMFQL